MSTADAYTASLVRPGYDALLAADQAALDALPVGLYLCSSDGTIRRVNCRAAELWGWASRNGMTDRRYCGAHRLHAADGALLPPGGSPMADALRSGKAARDQEVEIEQPDGSRVPVLLSVEPFKNALGQVLGGIGCFVDRPGRTAEQQYRFTDRLYRAVSLEDIYDAALDAITGTLRCDRASILLCDSAGAMRFVSWRGLSETYRKAVEGHTPWGPHEKDPPPLCIDDLAAAELPAALKAAVKAEGIGAAAFIPLMTHGVLAGKFMAYYDAPHAFSEEERDLAVTIARQLGFGLERMRAEQRRLASDEALRGSEERLRAMFDHAGVGMIVMGPDCRIVQANAAFAKIVGRPLESLVGGSCLDFTHPDDFATNRAALGALRQGHAPAVFEKRYLSPGGMSIWVRVTLSYVGVDQILAVVEDVTIRVATRAALSKSEAEFRTLADNMHQFAWMTDQTGWIYWYNKRWFDYTGTTLDEMQGWGWRKVHHPEHVDRVVAKIRACFESGEPWEDTFPLRSKDGEYRWFLSRALPIRDEEGHIVRWFGTNTDITERLRSDEQRTVLINELNHRVKNTLATVQAIVAQTLRGVDADPGIQERLEARLVALSNAHDILTQENWEGAEIHQVMARALQPHAGPARISVEGPAIRLVPKAAVALTMGMHELATNAAKYGALSTEDGHIDLSWSIDPAAPVTLTFEWAERGGPAVRKPTRRGFGSRLIERNLAHDLDGEAQIEYRPEGVRCTIACPLEAVGSLIGNGRPGRMP
jgi:PAS domain S-box-containing protein